VGAVVGADDLYEFLNCVVGDHQVFREWSGLGYNRRALYVKRIAEIVVSNEEYDFLNKPGGKQNGNWYDLLQELPGIGPHTAGSILAFAFNIPQPFIETNIRSVFIHFFFKNSNKKVRDDQIMPLVEKTLAGKVNKAHAREWYYALMDYGAYVKKQGVNPSRKSAHHSRQKPFKGSNRELRSRILRLVMTERVNQLEINKQFKEYPVRQVRKNLDDLIREGFLKKKGSLYTVK